MRINSGIVILFNGGLKDGATHQESTDLSMKFYETQTFVKQIEKAINEGTIQILDRRLTDSDGNENIEL